MNAHDIFEAATREVLRTRGESEERMRQQMEGAIGAMAPFVEGLRVLLCQKLILPTNVTYNTPLGKSWTLYPEQAVSDVTSVTLSFGGFIAPAMRVELRVNGVADGTLQTVLHDPTYALYGEGELSHAMTRERITAEEALSVACQVALVMGMPPPKESAR